MGEKLLGRLIRNWTIVESKHHAGLLSRKNGGLCFIGTTIGEIQGRREWTKNADTRLWVKNAIRRCHTGEMRSPSGRTNLRKVASSYEKEKDSVVHVDEKDTNGIRVRLPRQSRAAWSHSTMLLTVAYVQCLVKDAESLSSNNPKSNGLIIRNLYPTIPRPRVASHANEQVPKISLLPPRPPPAYLPCSPRQQVHGHNTSHLIPAAFPQASSFVPVPTSPPDNESKEERGARVQLDASELLSFQAQHGSDNSSTQSRVL